MGLELGVVMPVGNNGWIISAAAPQYRPTFAHNRAIAELAERIGFDYVFSMAKWKGFGGTTEFWNYSLESMTLMSALAPLTRDIRLIASVAPSLIHPAVYAKMAATLDEVSGGRLLVNIVSAANRDEYTQLGLYPDDFESYRYAYTEEWLEVCKRLWTKDRVTFEGQYFAIEACESWPKPIQQPHPPVVCATSSDAGFDFVARHCEYAFISGNTLEQVNGLSLRAKRAGQAHGRAVRTQLLTHLLLAETDAAAQATHARYLEAADLEAIANVFHLRARDRTAERAATMEQRYESRGKVFYGGFPCVGGPETIAGFLEDLVVHGEVDGLVLTFPDFVAGLHLFHERVQPLLQARGLWQPPAARGAI